jgi:hypothetical protein
MLAYCIKPQIPDTNDLHSIRLLYKLTVLLDWKINFIDQKQGYEYEYAEDKPCYAQPSGISTFGFSAPYVLFQA